MLREAIANLNRYKAPVRNFLIVPPSIRKDVREMLKTRGIEVVYFDRINEVKDANATSG